MYDGCVASKFSVAVIIPTHNRLKLLPQVLDSIFAQSVPLEILVMDDASSDGTESAIREKYPKVIYHRENISRGPTFQRNKAAALTQADILCTIDDDCILQSPKTVEQTLDAFDHPRVAAVTMPFVNILQNPTVRSVAPNRDEIFASYDYFGGMVALRRDVYRGLGGYRPFYFIQVEEPDLMIRMLQAGYIVRLGWADPLHHLESHMRDTPGRDRQGPRNYILFSYYNVPWPNFPLHLTATAILCMRHGFRIKHPIRAAQGLGQGFAGIIHEWGSRSPVPQEIYRLARDLKKQNYIPLREMESFLPPLRKF
jgi:glycosyltransferase involved in cell wall biosynthesis